jgi:Ca-activated chloride channel family protein
MIRGGINRVILCTDGDFNVGVTNRDDLVRMIEEKAKSGVQLSVLGFGMGNYKDATLEKLADKGDGNYAYIDTESEARKVLVDQLSSTLITIAKDVKIQIEFNPAQVASYRLLGYENRVMPAADFNNDKKDAGEIGAGHAVTALYEIAPEGVRDTGPGVDALKYQPRPAVAAGDTSEELLTLKLRYKLPGEETSKLIEAPVKDAAQPFSDATNDFKFSAAVASFGMLLRHSRYAGAATFDTVIELATAGRGSDLDGYREEFLDLVRRAKALKH